MSSTRSVDMRALHTTGPICAHVGIARLSTTSRGWAIHCSMRGMCSAAVTSRLMAAMVATTTDIRGRAEPSFSLPLYISVRKICEL